MRIMHTSDWHVRDRDIGEIEKCLTYLVQIAKKEKVDIIIHSGDVFDSRLVRMESASAKLVFKTFAELGDIAPVAIITGTASHEGTATELLSHIKSCYPVWCSSQPEQLYLCKGYLEAEVKNVPAEAPIEAIITMVPAPDKSWFKSGDRGILDSEDGIAQSMSMMLSGFAVVANAYSGAHILNGCPHILVGHWQIDGAMISETQSLVGRDISLSREQMTLSKANICLMGHIHKAQQIGENIFYSGSIIPLTWGELDPKGLYIHEIEGKGLIESRFIKTPSKKLTRISEDLTRNSTDIDEWEDILCAYNANAIENAFLRITISVFQDDAKRIETKKVKDYFLSAGAQDVIVDLVRIPRENVRSQTLLQLKTLREKLVEQAKLRAEIVSESILLKADMIETEATDPDKIIKGILSL